MANSKSGKKKTSNKKTSGQRGKIRRWLPEEISQLWSGTQSEVAEKIGRTPQAVSVARATFARFKPGNSEGLVPTEVNLSKAGAKTRLSSERKNSPKQKRGMIQRIPRTNVPKANRDTGATFKASYNGQLLELPQTPASLRIDDNGLSIIF